jgi:protein-arginine kinase activator protein McsA
MSKTIPITKYSTIGLCQKCFTSGIHVTLTKIGEKEGMVTQIAICEKCRK